MNHPDRVNGVGPVPHPCKLQPVFCGHSGATQRPMRVIVGLGNPGSDYARTRHNVGYMVVDRLTHRHGLTNRRTKFHAQVITGTIGGTAAMMLKPGLYMNRSGTSVAEVARFYKLERQNLLIVMDDTALPLGRVRLRPDGGHGGHNGLADIERALGSPDYPRLRVGIDRPDATGKVDHVLGRFTSAQFEQLQPTLDAACDAIECWITDGIDLAMNRFNPSP